jgi:hypothetical protein
MSQVVEVVDRAKVFQETRIIAQVALNCVQSLRGEIDQLEVGDDAKVFEAMAHCVALGLASLHRIREKLMSATSPAVLAEVRKSLGLDGE